MKLHNIQSTTIRAGLTLVEMLVALALSVFMMAILSEAFVEGLKSFSQLKALGDLDDRLRTVANVLRRDLRAPHFEGNKRLSECTASGKPMPRLEGLGNGFYNAASRDTLLAQLRPYESVAPRLGFFAVEEWPNSSPIDSGAVFDPTYRGISFEGVDKENRPSYRDATDVLHFSTRLDGNEEEKFFFGQVRPGSLLDVIGIGQPGVGKAGTRYDAALPNGMYSSQWAELLYFLGPDGSVNAPGAGKQGGPVLTFNLYRRRLLMTPDQFSNGDFALGDNYYDNSTPAKQTINFFRENDVSAYLPVGSTVFLYNTPADAQHLIRRYQSGNQTFPHRTPKINVTTGQVDGGDLLLTNVISFDVKVWDPFAYRLPLTPGSGRGAYVDVGDNQPMGTNAAPTAWTDTANDALPAVYAVPSNPVILSPPYPAGSRGIYDTGTLRQDGPPNDPNSPLQAAPPTHRYPFNSIQITIRVFDPKTQQTRQITIIQDM